MQPCPKPESRSKQKDRDRRAETARIQAVRAECERRDGFCRLSHGGYGPCTGKSEWAHLGDKTRAKTRGMAPEDRHDAAWTAMLCTGHHAAYDRHELDLRYLTARKANGPLLWLRRGVSHWLETSRMNAKEQATLVPLFQKLNVIQAEALIELLEEMR